MTSEGVWDRQRWKATDGNQHLMRARTAVPVTTEDKFLGTLRQGGVSRIYRHHRQVVEHAPSGDVGLHFIFDLHRCRGNISLPRSAGIDVFAGTRKADR